VRNLSSESLVVHQQEVQLINIVNEELFQSIGQNVAGLLVAAIPNLDPGIRSLMQLRSEHRAIP